MKKLFRLMFLFWVFLIACRNVSLAGEMDDTAVPPTPTTNPDIVEVPVEIVTPEPTPTTAACTPLPDGMTLNILFESNLHGVIEVEGLQSGEKPILLLTGEGPTGNWRFELKNEKGIEPDGRFQHTFDFRSWDSVEGYEFKGQLIHNRGAACFTIDLPLADKPIPVLDTQVGVTVTAVTADFAASATTIDTLVQVDPIWEMDPTAFPPQQALTYVTFPDSLIDDQGRSVPPTSRDGETAVLDPQTGGLQQLMHNQWEAVPADARVVTATMRVELLNLHRLVDLPLDWGAHQAGDVWEADVLLPIGYAVAQIRQIEWVETLADGRAHLRFTIVNGGPEGFRFTCLHLDTTDPWERDCANFDDELTVDIDLQPDNPVVLHMRAWVELRTPFQLVLDVDR